MTTNTTPENDEGLVAGQSDKPQMTINNGADFTTKFIAVYSRITTAIGMVDLALALMAAQFVLIVWGAF
ncbi:MAG: hypothetical protein IPN53_05980 [Comamonadaceae bacterium]|nr:hypothetical protein [Comamonadaceae bacterium]